MIHINESFSTAPDVGNIAKRQKWLIDADAKIASLVDEVANAITVKEYNTRRCEMALARAMAPARAGGASVAGAEAEAKAGEGYAKEIDVLQGQFKAAIAAIKHEAAAQTHWQTAQSLLSSDKEVVKHI